MSRAEAKRPTKPSRKPAKRSAKPRGKVGGARPNSGPDPVLGPGNVRSVIKTVRLSPVEDARQQTVARRAGAKDWGTWIRNLGNAEAATSDREVFADQLTREETSGAVGQLAGAVIDDTRLVSIAAGDAWPDDLGAPGGPGTSEAREMAAEIIKLRAALSEIPVTQVITKTLARRVHDAKALLENDLDKAIIEACGMTDGEEEARTDEYDNSIEIWGVRDVDLAAAASKLMAHGFDRVWLHRHPERGCCTCPVRRSEPPATFATGRPGR